MANFHELRDRAAAYISDHLWNTGWEHFIPLGCKLPASWQGINKETCWLPKDAYKYSGKPMSSQIIYLNFSYLNFTQ